MPEFDIQITSENTVTLSVLGRIDSMTVTMFRDSMQQAIKQARNIILNLGGVEYMSSAGLREIVNGFKTLQQKQGEICIVQPTERVFEVINMAGLDTLLSVYDSMEEAVKRFE